jgi:hypothetical protein
MIVTMIITNIITNYLSDNARPAAIATGVSSILPQTSPKAYIPGTVVF